MFTSATAIPQTDLLATIVAPLTIAPTACVMEAIALMGAERLSGNQPRGTKAKFHSVPRQTEQNCVLVLEDDHLVGLLTAQDLLQMVALGHNPAEVTISDILSSPVPTLRLSELADLAVLPSLFQQSSSRPLPVLDEQGKVVGVLPPDCLKQLLFQVDTRKLQEQIERGRLLTQIATQIRDSLNLTEVLGAAVTAVRAFLQCDRLLVYQFQPDWSGCVVAESVGEGWATALGNSIDDSCFREQAASLYGNGRTIVVENVHAAGYSDCHLQLLAQYQVKANLVVPILVSGNLWGLLIGHQCGDYRGWQTADLSLLEEIAVQLAIAIQQATTHEQLQAELNARQETELALVQSKAELQGLFAAMDDVVLVIDRQGKYLKILSSRSNKLYRSSEELIGTVLQDHFSAEQTEFFLTCIWQTLEVGQTQEYEYSLFIQETEYWFSAKCYPLTQEAVLWVARDISDRKRAEAQLEIQNTILKRIARGEPLAGILDTLLRVMETQLVGAICSIMLCVEDRLYSGPAPRLPESYLQAIDGIPVGEGIGSCGTAAFRREPVIVSDIATDPLWEIAREAASLYGLRACWSYPIIASDGRILGTFGVYYRECCAPQPQELQSIARVANIAGIAIERNLSVQALEQLNQELERRVEERTAALQKSEQRYRALMDSASDAILLADAQGNLTEANQKAEELLGYSREELTHLHVSQIHPPEVLEAVRQHFSGIILRNQGPSFETLVLRKDGSQIPVDITGSRIELQGESIAQGSFRDIRDRKRIEAERKQVELALQASEERYRQIVETQTEFVLRSMPDTTITFANTAICQALGRSPESVIGMRWDEFVPLEHLEILFQKIATLTPEQPQFENTNPDHRANGGMGWTQWVNLGTFNERGELVEIQSVGRDVTQLHQTEDALRQSEERLNLALQAAQIGIWEWDPTDDRLLWDDRMFTLYGINREDFTGQYVDWQQRVHPDDLGSQYQAQQQALKGEQSCDTEFRIVRPDGTIRSIASKALIQWNEQGKPQRVIGLNIDITDRKQAEQENQQLRERLQFVLSSSPAVIFTCKPEGDFGATFISDNITRVMGYTPTEFLADSSFWAEHIHPDDAPEIFANLPLLFERGYHTHEYRFQHRSGQYLWVRTELRLMRDEQGTPIEIVGYFADVSDLKQVEIALQTSETRFRRVFESRVVGMLFADLQGQILDANDRFLQIVGYTREDLDAGLVRWDTMTPPEYEALDRGMVEQLMQDGLVSPQEKEYYRKDGSRVPILIGAAILPGTADQTISVVVDISDRKRLEQEQQRLIAILEASTDYIGVSDAVTGQVIWNNAAIKQLCGLQSDAEVAQRTSVDYHPPRIIEMINEQAMPAAIATGSWLGESVLLNAAGQEIPVSQLLLAHKSPQGTVEFFSAIMRDIRVQKEYEQRLERTNAELMRATRLKDEFLANMSHELRTPLNAVLGMAESLLDEIVGPLNDRQKKAVATIDRSGQHLLGLINDVLELSKVEAGKLELNLEQVSIARICNSSLTFVRQQASKKQIQLSIVMPADLGEMVLDERRMRQVLINLLTNAIKFTPIGGRVSLEAHREPIEVSLLGRVPLYRQQEVFQPLSELDSCRSNQGHYLCISVFDTGIGIAPADQTRLFQPFIQIDSSLNRQYEGTGLGLALVRRIVELHGGEVSLHSAPGEGSCFTVRLPYLCGVENRSNPTPFSVPGMAQSPESASSDPVIAESTIVANHPLILLAEDNETNILTISSYLEAKGYRVLVAKNGQQAIALTQTHHPDLILMDIQMPGVDGLEAMQTIRQNPELAEIPIIALTALAMEGDRERCLGAGARDYLTKPVILKHLTATIQRLLNTK